jgi:hypothetical protein
LATNTRLLNKLKARIQNNQVNTAKWRDLHLSQPYPPLTLSQFEATLFVVEHVTYIYATLTAIVDGDDVEREG